MRWLGWPTTFHTHFGYVYNAEKNYLIHSTFNKYQVIKMAAKYLIVLCVAIHCCLGGVVPAVPAVAAVPAAYSVPYASSYSASVVDHAIAAPVAQPLVAAPAFAAPAVAAPAFASYAAYNALPYAYAPAPLIAG
ncbi:cuticle protein 16.5-like [Harmonia axyridis]|uniref:cuticle protein 16.5-like n=1 Tax=Harmonia axyridis TaxID=115357 RepID=UPI001E278724|nr:cuticle protein 16.5-like [Harmonia axyridis]